jgi:hypothetical protein
VEKPEFLTTLYRFLLAPYFINNQQIEKILLFRIRLVKEGVLFQSGGIEKKVSWDYHLPFSPYLYWGFYPLHDRITTIHPQDTLLGIPACTYGSFRKYGIFDLQVPDTSKRRNRKV